MEHDTYRQWLDLEVEGELPEDHSGRLAEHLAACRDCRADRRRLVALRDALGAARIPVRDAFHGRVMASLPAPAWRPLRAADGRPAWRPAAALLLVLAALSALLFATAGSDLAAAPLAGATAALVELVGAAMVTGAGLLAASWSGVGMVVGEMFSSSPLTLAAVAALLLFLSLLLAGLLRRPRTAEGRPEGGSGGRAGR